MTPRTLSTVALVFAALAIVAPRATGTLLAHLPSADPRLFQTSDQCIACHNNLITPAGENVSIGPAWRSTMMANSARDPYWQASVRREVLDHPESAKEIENECSRCHMPMMQTEANAAGRHGEVFANLPIGASPLRSNMLAADGVSCALCHQISDDKLGSPESFSGHYQIDKQKPWGARPVFGRHEVDSGRATIMHSSSEYLPTQGLHVQKSELCATCHTLFTEARDASGKVVGRLPEQVPYLEWRNSSFASTKTCQACHMPQVTDSMPISGVWGQKRAGLARHEFEGGNFFMLDMLDRYRDELGVVAPSSELRRAVQRTAQHLSSATARVSLRGVAVTGGRLNATVMVENLTGHKFPTAYPSRRAWLDVVVRDATGRTIFESGAIRPDGSIDGNDNDANAAAFEPHYAEIRSASEVQIYESMMVDVANRPTTGLLSAVRYVKDNRLLPSGFEKRSASPDVAVHGAAMDDADFVAGGDAVRYNVDVGNAAGPFSVTATLRFQPIAFRWASNLGVHSAPEITRFTKYYRDMAQGSSVVIARDSAQAR